MAVRVTYSPEYRRVRERLSPATRMAVGIAEDEIASDPELGHDRRESGGSIFDYSAQETLIQYRRLHDGAVEFERLIDLRDPDL